jgi:hypothetical protein
MAEAERGRLLVCPSFNVVKGGPGSLASAFAGFTTGRHPMNKVRVIIIAALFVVVAMVSIAIGLILFQGEGTAILFDGKTTSGWVIEGDSEVKDGELIFGGKQKTRVRIADDVRPIFELHLEYSTENNQPIQLEWHSRGLRGRGMHSGPLERRSSKPGEWLEAIFGGHENAAGGWSTSAKWRAVGDAAFTERPQGGTAELPSSVFVAFEMPAGQKLYLRNVRAKMEPVSFLPWLLLLMSAAVVGVLVIAVTAWALARKRGAAAPSQAEATAPRS